MHVLVCICSNVRQFQEIIDMIQMCYHTNHCACWPCFVNTGVFLCYKTEKGTLTSPSFILVTLRVLALLGQVTWTETVAIRGGLWRGGATSGGGGGGGGGEVGVGSSHPAPSFPLRREIRAAGEQESRAWTLDTALIGNEAASPGLQCAPQQRCEVDVS